jgi:hypothetical protein
MANAIYHEVLLRAQAVLQALTFDPPLTAGQILVRKLPAVRDQLDVLPCIILCTAEEGELQRPLSFRYYDVIYAVQLTIVQKHAEDVVANHDRILRWREQLRAAFQHAALAGVPSVWATRFEPEAPLDRRKLARDYDYSSMIVRFHSQEELTKT